MKLVTDRKITFAATVAATLMLLLSACSPKPSTSPVSPETAVSMQTKPLSPSDVLTPARKTEFVKTIAERAKGIEVGSKDLGNVAYVFFDPKCSHCGDLWNASKPLQEKVHFVWIPVALLGEKSKQIGATLLGASDQLSALDLNEMSTRTHGEGISVDLGNVTKFQKTVQTNTEVLENLVPEFPITSVPFTIFKNGSGEVEMIPGSMSTTAMAAQMHLK